MSQRNYTLTEINRAGLNESSGTSNRCGLRWLR